MNMDVLRQIVKEHIIYIYCFGSRSVYNIKVAKAQVRRKRKEDEKGPEQSWTLSRLKKVEKAELAQPVCRLETNPLQEKPKRVIEMYSEASSSWRSRLPDSTEP